MIKDDIIRMAREAGFEQLGPDIEDWVCFTDEIERFAALVATAEREACAHMVEDWDLECFNYLACPRVVADAIRARGEK